MLTIEELIAQCDTFRALGIMDAELLEKCLRAAYSTGRCDKAQEHYQAVCDKLEVSA